MPLGGFGLSNTITLDVHTMDFDGDGLEDLLLSITSGDPFYYGGRLQALRSTGDGGFADVTSEYFDQQPDTDVPLQWLYIIDINGDGANDIVGDTFYGQVPYINDGTGHYILAPKLSGQYFATYLDIDNDGRVDVFSMQGGESPWVSIQYQRDASVPAIDGTSDDDAILGGLNDQLIKGFAGDDFIFGAIGDDTLQGGAGADALIGGLGSDTADYADRSQSVEITLVAGSKVIAKVNGADEDELTSIENLSGGSAGDKLTGDTGYNVLRGNGGNDTIDGGTGTGDTASFAGGWADYTITESGGVYMIADTVAGRDGTDTVTNIEQFRFNGAALAAASLFNLAPTASNDSGSSGNVLSNDTDANAAIGDTKTVTGIRTGMESAGGSFGAVGALVGKYGTLTIASNGAFSYTRTASDPDTRALLPGQTATEFFTYRVRDAKGLSDTAQLSITVTGSNDAPTIVSNGGGNAASIQVAENLQLVTTVAATDPDGQSRTYSISGGADAAKFSIDATTGKLSFVAAPDFEQHRDANRDGTYVVTVRAFDGSLSDTQTLSIRVTDVGGNTVNGTSKADKISLSQKIAGKGATNEEDKFDGRAGNDKLDAAGGNDTVKGGSGNDALNGGLGKDALTGGDGKDKFVFNTALSSANVDTIDDFKHDADLIQLDDAIFTKIGSKLESAEFYAAKGAVKAHDKSDRIIYDTKTGKLYFDADGSKKGGVDAVHFATLTKHPLLDHGDFAIV
jgi:VCBS repeat-containing protein